MVFAGSQFFCRGPEKRLLIISSFLSPPISEIPNRIWFYPQVFLVKWQRATYHLSFNDLKLLRVAIFSDQWSVYCGDGICDAGEDCLNCRSDCAGKRRGRASKRYCCGNGIQEGPEGDGSLCDGNY